MDAAVVTERDLKELESFLLQAQTDIAVGFQNLRSPVDSSFSGEETASIDTGIGSSDEPCVSPLFPVIKHNEDKSVSSVNKVPSCDRHDKLDSDKSQLLIPNGNGKSSSHTVDACSRRDLSMNSTNESSVTNGRKNNTIILRLITEESRAFGTITTGVDEKEDVIRGVTDGETPVESKTWNSEKELLLNGRKVVRDHHLTTTNGPRVGVKPEDFELFIPPPPPLSPFADPAENLSNDVVKGSSDVSTVVSSSKDAVTTEISGEMELRISDCNMNPLVNENAHCDCNRTISQTDKTTAKSQSGVCKVVIWEPRERFIDPHIQFSQGTQTRKTESTVVTGKRKNMEEIVKNEDNQSLGCASENKFVKTTTTYESCQVNSVVESVSKNGDPIKMVESRNKVDRSKLSLNLMNGQRLAQVSHNPSVKRLSPITPEFPKSEKLQLGKGPLITSPNNNTVLTSGGQIKTPVASQQLANSPVNGKPGVMSPMAPSGAWSPTSQPNVHVQSAESTGRPTSPPPKSPGTSLLDTLHKKYYAHQYSKDKVQKPAIMCNTSSKKDNDVDPFERMLPSSMCDSLNSKSGIVHQRSQPNAIDLKAIMKHSPVSPVKDINIVHTITMKEQKQKKSKYGPVSFGSFRNKIKPEVIENKYAQVESPPPAPNLTHRDLVWDANLPPTASTLPWKLHENGTKDQSCHKDSLSNNRTHSLPKSKSDYAKISVCMQSKADTPSTSSHVATSRSLPDFQARNNKMPSSRSVCESIPEHCSKEDLQQIPKVKVRFDERKSPDRSWLAEPVDRESAIVPTSLSGYELSGGVKRELRAGSLPHQTVKLDDLEDIMHSHSYTVPRVRADLCLHNLRTDRQHAEIEGVEACKWLRAAGFPQYAQMYEDLQFPIDIASVEKDHDFLDKDSIQSLFRRLNTLNKCASMKIEAPSRKTSDDSDEEEQCALSDKWTYQRSSRRWSRLEIDVNMASSELSEDGDKKQTMRSCSSNDSVLTENDSISQMEDDSPLLTTKEEHCNKTTFIPGSIPEEVFTSLPLQRGISVPSPPHSPTSPRPLRRAASERVKGPSSILKRIENLTSNKRKKKSLRENVEISGPVLLTDCPEMQQRLQRLGCVDITPTSETLPLLSTDNETVLATDSGAPSPGSDRSSQSEKSTVILNNNNTKIRTSSSSSTEALIPLFKTVTEEQTTEDNEQEFILPIDHKPGTFPKLVSNGYISTGHGTSINCRTGSVNLGSESEDFREHIRRREKRRSNDDSDLENRMSVYDNVPDLSLADDPQKELDMILHGLFEDINGLSRLLNESSGIETDDLSMDDLMLLGAPASPLSLGLPSQQEGPESPSNHSEAGSQSNTSEVDPDQLSAMSISSNQELSDQEIPESKEDSLEKVVFRERRDSGVGSSLTRESSDRRRPRIRWHSFQKSHRPSFSSRNLQISSVSAGQMVVLKKLCLLKMTALMERYSPSNRSGWNWVMPKFIKKFKTPDYRDKNIFGVPLLVILQRTGQPLPQCMLYAMRFLRRTATDAVGIFRKSGVRSRIQKLRNQLETNPDQINFDSLQAYDVADLLKQYFRELPECLLTNKLSETFISIHQHIPAELRLEGLQAAIMLLPDENREVLQSLLLFLGDMANHSSENQMTASNLAVCFAPSLFHMCGPRSNQSTASPKRGRKNLGVPDQKELLEQKAGHECLTQMIIDSKQLFMIPEDTMMKCRFSYMEQGDPVSLEELIRDRNGDIIDFNTHIESWVQGLLKESRDKFKGWVAMATDDNTELAFKKVGDGHPLRLWKCSIDVEAPPVEVLNRVLRERHLWDDDLLKWRVVEKLDDQTEVYQYVCNSMAPHPSRDHCELRAWRSDLPKGACVLVSSSIEHPEAPLLGGVRGVVLASRWLIEPCGSGRSRLTHISRVDTRGRAPDWYNKSYGHIASNYVARISDSFRLAANISTEGPETKI